MKRRLLGLAGIFVVLVTGCMNVEVHRGQIHVGVALTDENRHAVQNVAVTLVLVGLDGKEQRYGPSVTDAKGSCEIVIPDRVERRSILGWRALQEAMYPLGAANIRSLRLDFDLAGKTKSAALVSRADGQLAFEVPREVKGGPEVQTWSGHGPM